MVGWVGLGWIGRAEDNFTRVMPTRRYSYTHISTIYLSSLPIIDPASHSIQMTVLEQTARYNTSLPVVVVVVAINRIDPSRIEEETLLLHTDKNCSCCGIAIKIRII